MENPVVIIGANALGKNIADIYTNNEVMIYGFLDENTALHNTEINEIPVLGSAESDEFLSILEKNAEYFIASDNVVYKKQLAENLKKNCKKIAVNCIHSNSYISQSAELGHGNLIDSFSSIKVNCKVGNYNNINSGVVLDTETEIGDFVQIGTNSTIGSGVQIANEVFIGSGVVIVSGVKIGKSARIGAGSVVIADVKEKETVFGNPAKTV